MNLDDRLAPHVGPDPHWGDLLDRRYVVVDDAEMGPIVSGGKGNYYPCTLVLEVDAALLAALARRPA